MNTPTLETLSIFIEACHRVAGYGLVKCSSGNLSQRLDDQHMLATTSRTWLADITTDQVAVCTIVDGRSVDDRKPTVEIGFHAGILRARPDVNVVLHFQKPFATALTCHRDLNDVNFSVIPEIPYYMGRVAVVPYIQPGSEELAEAVTAAAGNHDMVMMQNHGQVTVGTDFNHAIQNAVFFELACEIILRCGDNLRALPVEAVNRLRALAEEANKKN